MFMHKSKKGFTIVELVIVIAVIAILAAVLIPTFSNLVKKANQSADIQAARQMNTVLAAEGAVKAPDIFGLFDALAANGMSAKDYKPLTTDHYFFWDDDANRIIYTDKNYQVLFPTDFEKQGEWFSLTQTIAATKPAGFTATSTEVTVKTGSEMAYVLEQINKKATNKTLKITIPAEGIDMMGATFSVPELGTTAEGILDITPEKQGYVLEITGGPIKNATAVDVTYVGVGTNEGNDGIYHTALFGLVNAGNTLKIHDVTFENINIKNTNAGNVGILVGCVASYDEAGTYGTEKRGIVEISNVTIKNSTVVGHRSVGALIGSCQTYSGDIKLSGNITLDNVNVKTVGGRGGLLVGLTSKTVNTINAAGANIKLNNCSYSIYECEQNTGTFDEKTLGLQTSGADKGKIYSYALDNNFVNKFEDKYYVENSLVMNSDGKTAITSTDEFKTTCGATTVTGW